MYFDPLPNHDIFVSLQPQIEEGDHIVSVMVASLPANRCVPCFIRELKLGQSGAVTVRDIFDTSWTELWGRGEAGTRDSAY